MKDFKNLEPKDNFYQSSLFFPMPVVLVGTLTEDGKRRSDRILYWPRSGSPGRNATR